MKKTKPSVNGHARASAPPKASAQSNHQLKLRDEWSPDRTIHVKGNFITLHGALAKRVRAVCRKAGITPHALYSHALREGLHMRHVPVEMPGIYWEAAQRKAKAQRATTNEYLVGLVRRDIVSAQAGCIQIDPAVRAKIEEALEENFIPCSVEWFVANSAEHVAKDLGDIDLADSIRRDWKEWQESHAQGSEVLAVKPKSKVPYRKAVAA